MSPRNQCARLSSLKPLRHVLQGVPQLPAQVLDVQPLPLLHRLPGEVNVVHSQLGLVKQPLDNKDRTWGHKGNGKGIALG